METKKLEIEMVRDCNNLGFSQCYVVEKQRKSSGGLALAWKAHIRVDILGWSMGHIDALVVDKDNSFRLIGFYGNQTESLRRFSWQLLNRVAE